MLQQPVSTDLIEQDNGGRLEDGSGDGDALLLAAAQLQAALANRRVVTCRRRAVATTTRALAQRGCNTTTHNDHAKVENNSRMKLTVLRKNVASTLIQTVHL